MGRRVHSVWHAPALDLNRCHHSIGTGYVRAIAESGPFPCGRTVWEKAVGQDSLNSDYYDWLGRAYGRLAEGSSFLSALGYAKKTVRAFEQTTPEDPSRLEAAALLKSARELRPKCRPAE